LPQKNAETAKKIKEETGNTSFAFFVFSCGQKPAKHFYEISK